MNSRDIVIYPNARGLVKGMWSGRFWKIQSEYGSFHDYVWSFNAGKITDNRIESADDIPANTELSDRVSADLKRRGMKFVGSTIIYALLQAIGVVNDHERRCFRYAELTA